MRLIRYNQPNNIMRKRFSDIMDEFFNDAGQDRRGNFVPGIDIAETDNQFEVSVELPGIDKEDINVGLDNGRLTISGERELKEEEERSEEHTSELQSRFDLVCRLLLEKKKNKKK